MGEFCCLGSMQPRPGKEGVAGVLVLEGEYVNKKFSWGCETWAGPRFEYSFAQEVFMEIIHGIMLEKVRGTLIWGSVDSCS